MKRLRLDRWASQWQHPPRNPRPQLHPQPALSQHDTTIPSSRADTQRRQYQTEAQWKTQRRSVAGRRRASTAAAAQDEEGELESLAPLEVIERPAAQRVPANAPSHRRAAHSAKLAALHARLSLPAKLPLQTLARCLIHPSVDPRPGYNNTPLAVLGQDLLGYHTSEHLICHYPRLPMPVLFAAQHAYVGPATLAAMRGEWGVEVVAAPGPEVDPGLLQLKRMAPGNAMAEDGRRRLKDMPQARRLGAGRRNDQAHFRRGMSSRIVLDNEFGDLDEPLPEESAPYPGAPISSADSAEDGETTSGAFIEPILSLETDPVTVEAASASFIRALTGALYLHAGAAPTKDFHTAHILSRHLPLHELFHFTHPTRDLSRLCLREGFEPPVARLVSETGRLSRSPVFVVGVFSGNDKLGEGAGSSLNEARVRAAAAALRSWYLYSPPREDVMVPSAAEHASESGKGRAWKPQIIDCGEIIT